MQRAAAAALFLFAAAVQAQPAYRSIVAAAHPLAAEAGLEVLGRGGSAVDAAVAVQLVLGLVEPESSGIGGGAFLLYWSEKERRLRSYDGRETAPAAARPDRFLRDGKPMDFLEAAIGGRSVGVPGVLAMLELAHRRHGRLAWAELFAPAIRIAGQGFVVTPRLHQALEADRHLREDPEARRLYYPGGRPLAVGARLVNPAYAATLRRIADGGAAALHRGPIAADIVRAAAARGGDLTEADLAAYRPVEREPVCGPYRRHRVCSMGPPSSGGIAVLQILGVLERKEAHAAAPGRAAHFFAEAGKLAYADRARYGGDRDFVPVPIARLLSKEYLDARARLVGEKAMPLAPPGDAEGGTSHFSVADAAGDVVSMTTTIEASFGSRIMARGFHLNNELTDFDFAPGGANAVASGKRPRSSMSPVIVFDAEGRVRIALGSPGGSWIINYVARALVAMLDHGSDPQSAVAAPNFGSRNGPTVLEAGAPLDAMEAELKARGHEVQRAPLRSGLHAIERTPDGWRGGADPRREGAVRGR